MDDDLLASIVSFPSSPGISDTEYDKQARQLVKTLSETPAASLVTNDADGQDVWELVHPAENTIAYIVILVANVEALQKKTGQVIPDDVLPNSTLFQKIVEFFQNFDHVQVRYVGHHFRALLDIVVKAAGQFSKPWIAIPILRDVILRLDPTSSTLTSTHIQLVHLCLRLKLYRDALPILNANVFSVPPPIPRRAANNLTNWAAQESSSGYLNAASGLSAEISSREYMQYFIWASMVHIALKQWQRALLFLEVVLMTPASNNASLIQVEAYKKYVLIGLLHTGKHLPLPRPMNQATSRALKAVCRPYDVIAEDFVSQPARLRADIEAGTSEGIWSRDGTSGLLQEVLRAYRKFAVLSLAQTFTALPISEVARRTSPNPSNLTETREYISDLIITDELKAIITDDEQVPTLRFLGGDEATRSEIQLQAEIAQNKTKLSQVMELVSTIDHRIEMSPEYIEHLRRLKKTKEDDDTVGRKYGGPGHGAGGKGGNTSSVTDPLDEDVMADA